MSLCRAIEKRHKIYCADSGDEEKQKVANNALRIASAAFSQSDFYRYSRSFGKLFFSRCRTAAFFCIMSKILLGFLTFSIKCIIIVIVKIMKKRAFAMNKTIVSASILSADLTALGADLKKCAENGVDWIHFDVMDGIFVDNISYGIPVLEAVNRATDMFLDVHLMITDPYKYVDAFTDAGADMITFHIESSSDTEKTIEFIRSKGLKVGIAVRPKTPVDELVPFFGKVDMFLVMTVEPGFGGQGFIPETLDKVAELRRLLNEKGLDTIIQTDGGINGKTAPAVREAGCDCLVSGSYLFKAENMSDAVKIIRG